MEAGDVDPFITKLLIANGFISIMSFKGHFIRNVPENVTIESIESFIKGLSDNSPLIKQLNLDVDRKNNFKLVTGEIGTIMGIFVLMEEICRREIPFPTDQALQTSRNLNPSRQFQIGAITAANAANEVQKVIRRRLGNLMDFNDEEVAILRTKTDRFPFSFEVKCIHCNKSCRVTISQDMRSGHKYNIQTLKYTNHVKTCRLCFTHVISLMMMEL